MGESGHQHSDRSLRMHRRLVEKILFELLFGHWLLRPVVHEHRGLDHEEAGHGEKDEEDEVRPIPGDAQVVGKNGVGIVEGWRSGGVENRIASEWWFGFGRRRSLCDRVVRHLRFERRSGGTILAIRRIFPTHAFCRAPAGIGRNRIARGVVENSHRGFAPDFRVEVLAQLDASAAASSGMRIS